MIFRQTAKMRDGGKTKTRREFKPGDTYTEDATGQIVTVKRGGRVWLEVGRDRAIVPKRGQKQVGRYVIKSLKLEALHAITEADAIAEGIVCETDKKGRDWYSFDDKTAYYSAREAYRMLWESINGKGSWDRNPMVWVIETQTIEWGKPCACDCEPVAKIENRRDGGQNVRWVCLLCGEEWWYMHNGTTRLDTVDPIKRAWEMLNGEDEKPSPLTPEGQGAKATLSNRTGVKCLECGTDDCPVVEMINGDETLEAVYGCPNCGERFQLVVRGTSEYYDVQEYLEMTREAEGDFSPCGCSDFFAEKTAEEERTDGALDCLWMCENCGHCWTVTRTVAQLPSDEELRAYEEKLADSVEPCSCGKCRALRSADRTIVGLDPN